MNILCIGAHPDDLEFGCGGTLYRLAALGHKISLFVITNGGVGGGIAVRCAEQKKAAHMLSARLAWGGFKDANLPLNRTLIEAVEEQIHICKPDLVFTHYQEDTHQDHRAVAQAVITATRNVKNVLFFEGPTTTEFSPTVFTDINGILEQKIALLNCHKSQVQKTNIPNLCILEIAKSTAVFRGYQYRVRHAEGFVPQRLSLGIMAE